MENDKRAVDGDHINGCRYSARGLRSKGRARQMGKSLIFVSTQRTDFGLIVVSQQKAMLRVVAEQQTNTYPQVINAQWTDSGLMAVLKRMTMSRIVVNRRTYSTPQATTTHRTDSSLMVVLQRIAMSRLSLSHKRTQAQSLKVLAHAGRIP